MKYIWIYLLLAMINAPYWPRPLNLMSSALCLAFAIHAFATRPKKQPFYGKCELCKHHVPRFADAPEFDKCVVGHSKHADMNYCKIEREYDHLCGPQGKHFEEKT